MGMKYFEALSCFTLNQAEPFSPLLNAGNIGHLDLSCGFQGEVFVEVVVGVKCVGLGTCRKFVSIELVVNNVPYLVDEHSR